MGSDDEQHQQQRAADERVAQRQEGKRLRVGEA
jgi:hypothetical protein